MCSGYSFTNVGAWDDPYFVDGRNGALYRFRHQYLKIGLIELDQQIAGLDLLVVLDMHGDHRPRHARADGGDVPVDLRVVGVLEVARVQPPDEPDDQRDRHRRDGDDLVAAGLLRILARLSLLLCVVAVAFAPFFLVDLFGHDRPMLCSGRRRCTAADSRLPEVLAIQR